MKETYRKEKECLNKNRELRQQIGKLNKIINVFQKREERLKESEKKYRELIDLSPQTLYEINDKGYFTFINKKGLRTWGFSKSDLKKGLSSLQSLIPEDRPRAIKNIKKVLNSKKLEVNEYTALRKDGTTFPIIIYGSPRYNKDNKIIGTRGVVVDISKIKKVEKALRQSQLEFASLFENNPEALIYLDNKNKIININSQFTKLFGFTLKEVKGKNINDGIIHPLDKLEEAKYLYNKVIYGDYYINYETVRKKKDGTLFPVLLSASAVVIDGDSKGKIVLYRDITTQKQDEKLQKVLYHISKASNSQLSLDQLYPLIHKELTNIIDATNFFIGLFSEEKDKISFPYYIDEKEKRPSEEINAYGTLSGYIGKTGKSLLVNNKQIRKLAEKGKIKLPDIGYFTSNSQLLGVPLKIEGRVIGIMVVQSYTNSKLYSKKDIKLMEFISQHVATSIQRKQFEEKLEKLAHFDSLTSAYNRGYGLSLLEQQLKLAHRNREKVLLVYLDIDGFKDINDTYGHKEGDAVLIQVVKLFKATLREIDIICRIGGDEFLLIFPDSSPKDLPTIMQRLDEHLYRLNKSLKKPYQLGFSMGISSYDPDHPHSIDELITTADLNMYQEKKRKT